MNPYQSLEVQMRWSAYHNLIDLRDRATLHECLDWLHDPLEAQKHVLPTEPIYFTPKPSKDIRAEKTRDYRKRRPKAARYNSEVIVNAMTVFCLLGGFKS